MRSVRLKIDQRLCWGCKTCEVACKSENRAPDGVQLIRVEEDGPRVSADGLVFTFRVRRCLHCARPACVAACPETAFSVRPDGVVLLDQTRCSGCRACLEACPHGAIAFATNHGVAAKCDLCHHRLDRGLLPACADNVCLAHCIHLEGLDTLADDRPTAQPVD